MRKLLLATLLVGSLGSAMADPKGVVMDFGALDTIDALGSSEAVIALPQQNAPEYLKQYTAEKYQNTGGMKEPNIELIRNAKPDFIVISGRQGKFIDELKAIAPVTNFSGGEDYLGSAQKNIIAVGKVVGKEAEAKAAWDKLDEKLKATATKNAASPKKAVVVMHNDGKIGVANNSGYATLIHEVAGIKRADEKKYEGRVAADAKYFTDTNPDIIFIVDRSAAIGATPMKADYFKAADFANVQAVKDGKVIVLNPKLWYLSGRGLQSIELQVDEVTKAVE
ncbi:ABC transporter substrate-binding protein [Wohlfahrtiimonas larvae]|uniref:Siderophore ABC transporter substrate-binding protein n=1 Tax=Wohlfahrtiimonas larvae TaxID=1157986 RepID=A0ABP9MLR3_9GAMM|nr:ABC transporter substrate-binding protein [Wohlfahrtiimonas larvae]